MTLLAIRASDAEMADSLPFTHIPVMLNEVTELFAPLGSGTIVDATLGGAGHAGALALASPERRIIGIDQDPVAIAAAEARFSTTPGLQGRLTTVRARFDGGLASLRGHDDISGVLFDLGVSSPQFDRPERGFSYRADAPLDMRMNPDLARNAADLIAESTEAELITILERYGDERFAKRIARAIVTSRPVSTTKELAQIVASAIPAPARRRGGNPAKRTFQALRIAVNDELVALQSALAIAFDVVRDGGRIVVISYHSGEDRIVKAAFAEAISGGCECPVGLPCVCGATPSAKRVRRATPSNEEIQANPRASSARLRAVEVVK